MHWVPDVSFNEDGCRARCDHAAQNRATVRHVSLNLLEQEQTAKLGIKNKRLRRVGSGVSGEGPPRTLDAFALRQALVLIDIESDKQ